MRYAHNYWLDTARTAGLLPFFFLVLLTIKHVKLTIRLIKLMDWGLIRSLLIICNIGFLLTFFVEPVMEGNMYYVFLFFVFMGLTKQLILFYKHNRITVF